MRCEIVSVRINRKLCRRDVGWTAIPESGRSRCASAAHAFNARKHELKEQLDDKEQRILAYERRLNQAAKAETAQKLMEIPCVGPIIATAVMASVADPHHFRSGRDFAANLGLVPREHSSGGKQRLYGITCKGDSHLRTFLIHGARSALRSAANKPDRQLCWARKVAERRSFNVAAVALANKMARVIWHCWHMVEAMFRSGRTARPDRPE